MSSTLRLNCSPPRVISGENCSGFAPCAFASRTMMAQTAAKCFEAAVVR